MTGLKPRPCNAVIVANETADIPGTVGYQMPYLVSCPVCAARSIAAELAHHPRDCSACAGDHRGPNDPPAWSGFGETYAADYTIARQLAHSHNQRHIS